VRFNRWFAKATHGYVALSRGLIRKALVGVLILAGFALVDGVFGRRLPT
jgi:HAE1 family hydrophobic/amphiphilic exporter-1